MVNGVMGCPVRLMSAQPLRFQADKTDQHPNIGNHFGANNDKPVYLTTQAEKLFTSTRDKVEATLHELETSSEVFPGLSPMVLNNRTLRIENSRRTLKQLDKAVGKQMTPVVLSIMALEKTIHMHNLVAWEHPFSWQFAKYVGQSLKNRFALRANLIQDIAALGVCKDSLISALAKMPQIELQSRFLVDTPKGKAEESGLDHLTETAPQYDFRGDLTQLPLPFQAIAKKYTLSS